ncbi:substrate-binding periplasmic protein [Formivibrio citricus]|nr:transporter substrate-binding domain-containing protein [Formivibrio citricus]
MALSNATFSAEPLPELTIYHYERMPFFGNNSGKEAGILIDISRMIFDQAKIRHKYVEVPVRRLLESLKEREYACTIGALKTTERETLYAYSDDFIYQDQPFRIIIQSEKKTLLPENPTVRQILESELRLGVIDGHVYGSWLDGSIARYKPRLQKINIGDDTERMHKMIAGDRIDYMFAVAEEAKYVINNNREFAEKLSIVKVADAPAGNRRYILCSKEVGGETLKKINAAIKTVKASANYKRLISQQAQ